MSKNSSFLKIINLIWKYKFGQSQPKSFPKVRGNHDFARCPTLKFIQQNCSLKV